MWICAPSQCLHKKKSRFQNLLWICAFLKNKPIEKPFIFFLSSKWQCTLNECGYEVRHMKIWANLKVNTNHRHIYLRSGCDCWKWSSIFAENFTMKLRSVTSRSTSQSKCFQILFLYMYIYIFEDRHLCFGFKGTVNVFNC